MKIVMFLEKALIDSTLIKKDKVTLPGYLSSCVRQLKEKHDDLVLGANEEPEFLLFSKDDKLLAFEEDFNRPGLPFISVKES